MGWRQRSSSITTRLRRFAGPGPERPESAIRTAHRPPAMRSPAAERQLLEEGWVVVDLLDPERVRRLHDVWSEHHAEPGATWESDFYTKDPESKRRIHRSITEATQSALDGHLAGHETLLGVFVTNWPGSDGGLTLHHHSTVVDPSEGGSLVVWCAVSETTEANGTLHLVPRSHLLQAGIRPERTTSWHEEHEQRILDSHLVSVPLRPGQAIVFDNQLLHCSLPNETGSPRIATASIVVPRGASARYHEVREDGLLAAYRLTSEFFIDNDPGSLVWARPTGLDLIGTEAWSPTTVTTADLESTLAPGTCSHPAGTGTGTNTSATAGQLRPIGLTVTGAAAPPVIADRSLQRELAEYGFTILPPLEGRDLERARSVATATGPAPDDPQRALNWSFHSRADDHKRQVSASLLTDVWAVIEGRFVRQRPFLSTFITKWPGPDSGFAPHQDPTLVDERHAVGVTVWIPLHDVDHRNGMLWIVPGSHRLPGGFRVADVDQFPFAEFETDIIEEFGAGIPLSAGEILVFDNRVIHHSLPNCSDRPRVVASFGLCPEDGPSTSARRVGDEVHVHALPEHFFIDVAPSEHHSWQPDRPPLFTAPADQRRWARGEFADLCNSVPRPPRTVRPGPGQPAWRTPGAFCALCGSDAGLTESDRNDRNNAQLVCPPCRAQQSRGHRSTPGSPVGSPPC